MKIIVKNSSLEFQKAKIISNAIEVNVTTAAKIGTSITLSSLQNVGTYFKIRLSGDTGLVADSNPICLFINGWLRTDIPLDYGDNIFYADSYVNKIGIGTYSKPIDNGTLNVTVEYADNPISYESAMQHMTEFVSIIDTKPSGTPPSTMGPYAATNSMPKDVLITRIYKIANSPLFQFQLGLYDESDAYVDGMTIRTTSSEYVVSTTKLQNVVTNAKFSQIQGNAQSSVDVQVYFMENT